MNDQAQEMSQQMQVDDLQENNTQTDMPTLEALHKAYGKQLEVQRKTLVEGPNPFLGSGTDLARPVSPSTEPPGTGEKIYLMISSSVPVHTLRNLLADAGRVNDARLRIVLRGTVGKDINETYSWIRRVALKDPDCRDTKCQQLAPIDLNPNPFRDFGIERVPALVWSQNKSSGQGAKPKSFLVLYGDASLKYGLERLASTGRGTLPPVLLKKLEQRPGETHGKE